MQVFTENKIISYSISSCEVDIGKRCWEIKDSKNHLVFKSSKELTQNEVVESIQDSSGDTLWTIRRPTRGWYLVIRSPKDDPKSFIALHPKNVMKGKSKATEFTFTLKSPSSLKPEMQAPEHRKKHSIDSTIQRRNQPVSSSLTSASPPKSTATSLDFEHDSELCQPVESVIRLKPIENDPQDQTFLKLFTDLFANTNQGFRCFIESKADERLGHHQVNSNGQSILLDYEDQNSAFGIQNFGVLKIHLRNSLNFSLIHNHDPSSDQIDQFHLHQAFWVSVCVAYLGFRADQDAYQAASQDS